MMSRTKLNCLLSDRGADPLFGVIANLRSFGRNASLRMRIPDHLVAREAKNPSIKGQPIKIRPHHLTRRPPLKQ
jgi:hypothetical protein